MEDEDEQMEQEEAQMTASAPPSGPHPQQAKKVPKFKLVNNVVIIEYPEN